MWRRLTVTIVWGLAIGCTALAQAPGPVQPNFLNVRGISEDYRVGPNDVIEIQIVEHGQLNQTLRISTTGEINFPLVGAITVANMTSVEVEAAIAQRLREKDLIKEPEVLVYIREYQAKPIYVSGAVVNPGEYMMSQELTVMDAILLAGGLQFNADIRGFIHRRLPASTGVGDNGAEAQTEVIEVDLKPLAEGRILETDIMLRRGDSLVVPIRPTNPFFVVGEVNAPKNYSIPAGQTLMASQAISWAGGPTATAKMSDGMLVRYDAQGVRQEVKVDYAAILRGRQDDFPIQPYDLIFIPGSKVKTIGQGMLMLTDTMVMTTSFRIARTYQLPDAPAQGQPAGPR